MLKRRLALGATLLATAVLAVACTSGGSGPSPSASPSSPAASASPSSAASGEPSPSDSDVARGTIVVGVSGAFAESQLVAEMYAQVLEDAGYTVERQLDLGGREVSDAALFGGEIDVKPEYLAFELPKLDADADATGTADVVFPRVQEAATAMDLTALQYSPANSTNVFVVLPETAETNNLTTVSSLAPVAGEMSLGAPPDCETNYACKDGLEEVYGVTFREIRTLDFGGPQTVAAIDSGAVQVGLLFSLDPTITEKGYVVLEDDKDLQPAGNFFPLIRTEVVNDEVTELLDGVSASLTTDGMLELVGRVQVDQEDVEAVAREHLTEAGLLGG
jgi:osmoprotectant transport system substrate-binding protein